MNRRVFLQSATILPLFGFISDGEVRANLRVDHDIDVNIIVTAWVLDRLAEQHRQDWIGRPFETQGEWYPMSVETRVLPESLAELPGTLTFHTARIGEAGEYQEYLVGAFRREHISCIVRIQEDHEALMHSIAEHIAAQDIPGIFESSWNNATLNRFIPNAVSLGREVEPGDAFWP